MLSLADINRAYARFDNSPAIIGKKTLIRYDIDQNLGIQAYNLDGEKYTNPDQSYRFPADELYDYRQIDHGEGAGVNARVDDKLTRPNQEPLPVDKLAERDTSYRVVLPSQIVPLTDTSFLVGTTLAVDPQKGYDPSFDRAGINCRHYSRRPDKFFKQFAHF